MARGGIMELKSFFELAANAKVGTVIRNEKSFQIFKLNENYCWRTIETRTDITVYYDSNKLSEKTWCINPVKDRNLNLIEACQLLKDKYASRISRLSQLDFYLCMINDEIHLGGAPLSIEDILANDWYVMSKV